MFLGKCCHRVVTEKPIQTLTHHIQLASMPATSMSADAFSKLATSIQGFGDSEVGWEKASLSRAEIIRLRADQEKTRVRAMVEQLRLASAQNRGNETDNETDQQTGKGETVQ